jgi:tricarballylate dehydrogenase
LTETFDVAVLGGGNAGLCAALSARERGASVVVVESAPRAFRGGNSRHTRNLRSMHDAPTDLLTDAYTEDEYVSDLVRVTEGRTDEELARLVVRVRRVSCLMQRWHRAAPLRGTLHSGGPTSTFSAAARRS